MKEKVKKSHGVQLLIRCIVTDPDGKVVSDTGEKPARSFVIQFLEFIGALFRDNIGEVSATATNGTEDPIYYSTMSAKNQCRVDAPANTSAWGLVVGTGDAGVTNTDHKLETQLTEGITAGKITHASVIFTATAVVGANVDLLIKRSFTNSTGSSIGVKEAGIYIKSVVEFEETSYFCIVRDVLPGTVNVPDKFSLTIIYTVRTRV